MQKYHAICILFIFGLIIRFAMILHLEPFAQYEWFGPFILHFIQNPSIDAWGSFSTVLPTPAFPYGIVMGLSLLPLTVIFSILGGVNVTIVTFGIKTTLLCFDALCFYLIFLHFNKEIKYLLSLVCLYWLSPMLLIATYWAGQLDIIPVALLLLTFIAIKKKTFFLGGIALSCAISAKMSMMLAVPFLLIYFFRGTRMRLSGKSFFIGFCSASIILLCLPMLLCGYREMVLRTGELWRLLDLTLSIGQAKIYITPLLISMVLYVAWSMARLTYHFLTALLALATLILILATPTPPGWFIWTVPFLLIHLVPAGILQRTVGFAFFTLVAVTQILFWPYPMQINFFPLEQSDLIYSFSLTLIITLGLILIYGILRNSFYSNDIFRFGKKPISIGIVGDSSTGKDTLSLALIDILGKPNTVHISGDDYHLWDRKGSLWKVMTHLNPRANDIKSFFKDINSILDKKTILYRKYQHSNGCFSQHLKLQSRNFCIVSGLHTLLQDNLSSRFDVKIFLEMDEGLRAYLKCRRDHKERNHSFNDILKSIEQRKNDAFKYIQPQQKKADIILKVVAVGDFNPADIQSPMPSLLLKATLRNSLYHEELLRYYIASCGLHVNIEIKEAMEEVVLTVEGDIAPEDVEYFIQSRMSELDELLAVSPQWHPNIHGLMQMIIMCHLLQKLKV